MNVVKYVLSAKMMIVTLIHSSIIGSKPLSHAYWPKSKVASAFRSVLAEPNIASTL